MSRVLLLLLFGAAGCLYPPSGSNTKGDAACPTPYYYPLTALDGPLVIDGSEPLESAPQLSVTTTRISDGATKTDVQAMVLADDPSQVTFDLECGYGGNHPYPCLRVDAPRPQYSCALYNAHLEFQLIPPSDWPDSLQTWDPVSFESKENASSDERQVCLWNDWCIQVD